MLAATGLLMVIIVVFFVVLDYLEHMDDFMDRGASWDEVVFTYYLNYIPEMIRLTSPLAIFLAAIYVAGRLAQSLQIVALHSAGVSLMRLMVPFVIVGVALTVGMFFFNGWLVPRTQAEVLEFQSRYLRTAAEPVQTGQVIRPNAPGSILSVGFYDRRESRGYRITLSDFDLGDDGLPDRLRHRLDAAEMSWVDSLEVWRMRDVRVRDFDMGGAQRFESMLDTSLAILPADLARTERDAERLTIPEAAEYLSSLRRVGADRLGRPLVAYYSKFSYPLANLILVLIGVPIASVRRRGGQAAQLAIGLLIAFAYLSVQKLTEPFGYTEALPPLLVAWLPHVLFACLAVIVITRTRR